MAFARGEKETVEKDKKGWMLLKKAMKKTAVFSWLPCDPNLPVICVCSIAEGNSRNTAHLSSPHRTSDKAIRTCLTWFANGTLHRAQNILTIFVRMLEFLGAGNDYDNVSICICTLLSSVLKMLAGNIIYFC